jgi:hypothetical protein
MCTLGGVTAEALKVPCIYNDLIRFCYITIDHLCCRPTFPIRMPNLGITFSLLVTPKRSQSRLCNMWAFRTKSEDKKSSASLLGSLRLLYNVSVHNGLTSGPFALKNCRFSGTFSVNLRVRRPRLRSPWPQDLLCTQSPCRLPEKSSGGQGVA